MLQDMIDFYIIQAMAGNIDNSVSPSFVLHNYSEILLIINANNKVIKGSKVQVLKPMSFDFSEGLYFSKNNGVLKKIIL